MCGLGRISVAHEFGREEDYGMLIVRWARPGLRTVTCDVWLKKRHIGKAETTVEVVER
jgi:hypothetical protein